MAQKFINQKNPPIVWSTIDEAFTAINANFDEIYATIGGALGSVVDFASLNSNVSPAITETYDLGSPSFRWRDLYLSAGSLYLGTARLTASGTAINLPAGSTVDGELIRNPAETVFKTIAVSGQDNIVADDTTDTLNIAAGNSGISITTNSTTDTLTISNTGILNVQGTANQIGVSVVSGIATITNLGVTKLTGETGGIGVSGDGTGNVTVTNLGVKQITAGTGISISPTNGTGTVQINNEGALTSFTRIVIDGDLSNAVVADGSNDTLNLVAGAGITINKNTSTDTITIENSNLFTTEFDLKGSVFADDSTLMVDGLEQRVFAAGGFFGNLVGSVTGNTNGVHTGNVAGNLFGNSNGYHTGDITGSVFADNSTMLVDGTNGQIVGPINSFDGGNSITMDPINGVIIGGTGGASVIGAAGAPVYIGGGISGSTSGDIYLGNGTNRLLLVSNIIDSDDSSALTFEPAVIFNSNIAVDGDLILNGDNRIQANTKITMVPTLSAENSGSVLNIQGIPSGEGSPGVILSTPSNFIQVGNWVMLTDGGLFGVPLSSAPVGAVLGAIYIADGVNWDPQSFSTGTPYPVFYDGSDFLPMIPAPTP